jgi:hypothetical protein
VQPYDAIRKTVLSAYSSLGSSYEVFPGSKKGMGDFYSTQNQQLSSEDLQDIKKITDRFDVAGGYSRPHFVSL